MTVLWLVWVSYPDTLTDVAVNNKVVNLTDIACAAINFIIMLLGICYACLLHKKKFVAGVGACMAWGAVSIFFL